MCVSVCVCVCECVCVYVVNLKCFFNKIKIVTCKPSGNGPRDGRLPGKHIMIRVVNCIVPLLQLEAYPAQAKGRLRESFGWIGERRGEGGRY